MVGPPQLARGRRIRPWWGAWRRGKSDLFNVISSAGAAATMMTGDISWPSACGWASVQEAPGSENSLLDKTCWRADP